MSEGSSPASAVAQLAASRQRSTILGCLLGVFVAHGAIGAEYAVLEEKSFRKPDTHPRALSLAKAAGGGYLVAGEASVGAFLMKIGPDFKKQWEQYPKGQRAVHEANTVVPTRDGGAVIAGHTYIRSSPGRSIDAPFATRTDKAGRVLWTREYGTRQPGTGNGRFACGVSTDRGAILVGTRYKLWENQPTEKGTALGTELWIVSVDDEGNVAWDAARAVDGDELIGTLQLRQEDCSTLVPDDRGHFALAVSVHGGTSVVRNGNRIVVGPEVKSSERRRVLVFKFDVHGKEVARARLADGNVPRLFRTESGYVVIDNSLSTDARGVRQTVLDRDLKVLSQRIIGDPRSYIALEAALADDRGGFHLAGYRASFPAGARKVVLAYLSASGEIIGETAFGLRLPSWIPVAFVAGERRGEVILLQRGEDDNDVKLMKLRHPE